MSNRSYVLLERALLRHEIAKANFLGSACRPSRGKNIRFIRGEKR